MEARGQVCLQRLQKARGITAVYAAPGPPILKADLDVPHPRPQPPLHILAQLFQAVVDLRLTARVRAVTNPTLVSLERLDLRVGADLLRRDVLFSGAATVSQRFADIDRANATTLGWLTSRVMWYRPISRDYRVEAGVSALWYVGPNFPELTATVSLVRHQGRLFHDVPSTDIVFPILLGELPYPTLDTEGDTP